jgi:hypothetical protein
VTGSYEYANERSCSIKGGVVGGICLLTERLLASNRVFCCMESSTTRNKDRGTRSAAVGNSQVMRESIVVMEHHGSSLRSQEIELCKVCRLKRC